MGPKKILTLTAVEVGESLVVDLKVELTSDEGIRCSRYRTTFYPIEEESCCIDDWVAEVFGTYDDPNEAENWMYVHGANCEAHGEAHSDQ